MSERVSQVGNQPCDFRRLRVLNTVSYFPEPRISELQQRSDSHVTQSS
jgi:hypothetical protein